MWLCTPALRSALLGLAAAAIGSCGFAFAESGSDDLGHDTPDPPRQEWSFYGPLGKFDQAQLRRGLEVYRQVCANCHSMKLVAFRELASRSGPGYSEAQAKAIAAEYKIEDGPNDDGKMFTRPGRLSDYFPSPFPNEQAARAALTAVPPDLSVIAKARTYERGFPLFLADPLIQYQEHGADYIYALLTGYTHDDDPNWDEYMPGHRIAMAKPLSDGMVEYADGTPQTMQHYAKDVTAFLMWAAEPRLEDRKKIGLSVIIYLVVFAALLYLVKRKIWKKIHAGH
jgi:ubiquinol-cytochrome c reductase cytochrome c1 subunit